MWTKRSSLMRGTWIEINVVDHGNATLVSSLMRGTWIEITGDKRMNINPIVVPHARDVD